MPSKQHNATQSPQEEIQLLTLLEFFVSETSWHLSSDDSEGLLFFMQTHRADKRLCHVRSIRKQSSSSFLLKLKKTPTKN